jgi:hypothetical protein
MLNGVLENSILFGFLTMFSFGLWIISIFSYRKSRNKKLIFVNIVFLIFFIKGVLLSLGIFISEIYDSVSIQLLAVFDLIIICLLFISVLKKQ